MTFRCPELLALAQLAPCCMHCRAPNRGDVVSAHSNSQRQGKSMGNKASDAVPAFLCASCHMAIDQGMAPGEVRRIWWLEACVETMRWLVENGHLVLSPASVEEVARRRTAAGLSPPGPKPKAKIPKGPKLKGPGFRKDGPKQRIPPRPWAKKPEK